MKLTRQQLIDKIVQANLAAGSDPAYVQGEYLEYLKSLDNEELVDEYDDYRLESDPLYEYDDVT